MILNKTKKILIVGLGVIGGSYAKVLNQNGYDVTCITERQEDIDYAIANGIIKSGTTTVDVNLVGEADVIIFALYPNTFLEWVKSYQHLFKSGAIITDVCGVKSTIVYKINAFLRKDVEYISAHPMAGRELSGVQHSDPSVFFGANYIVTPTDENTQESIEFCKELGRVLGFEKISVLSPEKHDEMIAFLSQLTHCIAVSLMTCNNEAGLEKYTGDSFRDLTRIAKINEKMWTELFLTNKDALLAQMDAFISDFTDFRNLIEEENAEAMMNKMRSSTARRSLFDKPKQ